MIPTSFAQLLDLIRSNGDLAYLFLFYFALANSFLWLVIGGYAAALGALDLNKVFLIYWAGGSLGDAFRFGIGRYFGPRLVKRFTRIGPSIALVARLVERHLIWVLAFHRFAHGIRAVTALACGVAKVPVGTFLMLTLATAGAWAAIGSATGYGFGNLSEQVLTNATSGIGIVSLLVFVGIFWLLSRKLDRAIEGEVRK